MEVKTKKAVAWIWGGLLFFGTFGSFVSGVKIIWEEVIVKMTFSLLRIVVAVLFFALGILIYRYSIARQKAPLQSELEKKTEQYDALIKECRKEEEVSKEHFKDFEDITLSFEDLFNTNKNPLVKLFNELYAKTPELLSYNNRLKDYISRSYNHYIKRLKKFDGTKECFELLVNEFENVFFAYEDLFVKPIEKRKDEIAKDNNLKSEFNKFATEYEHRRMQYKDYGEKMNRLFSSNIIRTDFDAVVTL